MKKSKLLVVAILALSMILSACGPTVTQEPTEPMPQPYPADPSDPELPTDPQIPDPYPIEPGYIIGDGDDAKGGDAYITNPQVSDDDLKDHAEDLNEFATDLYRKLSEEDGNLIFSPYSIFQAFLMTYAGADAQTKAEIADALDIDLDDGDRVHEWMNALNIRLTTRPEFAEAGAQPLEFSVANALWAQKEFHYEADFLDKLSANYNAGLKLVDFSKPEDARQLINLWVEAQTNEKIKDLIPEGMLNEMTRLVITNAVYFKGAWQHQFDSDLNSQESFFNLDGSETPVEMMHTNFTGSGFVNNELQAVNLPYEQSSFSMAIFMPTVDFKTFEKSLEEDKLEDLLASLNQSRAAIQLGLPKFKTESSFSLSEQLKALGMRSPFDSDLADFSGMTGQKDLYISDVVHKAFIDVNEEGTEAAAATAIGMSMTSMPDKSYTITLDHPFVYVIYDQGTGTIVFMGRVVAP